ncbi:MAG: hypothetical protein WKF58_00780 [Ilumatobacteraceae bacterium]
MIYAFIAERCADSAGRTVLSSVEGVAVGVLRVASPAGEPDGPRCSPIAELGDLIVKVHDQSRSAPTGRCA